MANTPLHMQHMLLHVPHSHSASHSQKVIPSLTITVLKKGILSLIITRCSSTAHAPKHVHALLLYPNWGVPFPHTTPTGIAGIGCTSVQDWQHATKVCDSIYTELYMWGSAGDPPVRAMSSRQNCRAPALVFWKDSSSTRGRLQSNCEMATVKWVSPLLTSLAVRLVTGRPVQ